MEHPWHPRNRYQRAIAPWFKAGLTGFISLLLAGLFWMGGWPLGGRTPAAASVHRYPLPNGDMMERSLQTLRDDRDSGWQVVLFRTPGHVPRLRVVGFPGVQIDRSAPMALARRDGWLTQSAHDSFEFAELAPNTAEYALPDLGELLAGDRTLDLTIPLNPNVDASPDPATHSVVNPANSAAHRAMERPASTLSSTTTPDAATITLPPFVIREWQALTSPPL